MAVNKFALHAILVLAALCCLGVVPAAAKDWSGVYTHDEESFEPDGSRISYWFRVELTDTGGKLNAILSNGTNGKTTRRVHLTVDAGQTRAQFTYDRCLPLVAEKRAPCNDTEFRLNDRLFALEEVPVHCQTELVTE